VRDDQ